MSQRRHVQHAGRAANPLAHILTAIDEPLDLIQYNTWNIIVPEGEYLTEVQNPRLPTVGRVVYCMCCFLPRLLPKAVQERFAELDDLKASGAHCEFSIDPAPGRDTLLYGFVPKLLSRHLITVINCRYIVAVLVPNTVEIGPGILLTDLRSNDS